MTQIVKLTKLKESDDPLHPNNIPVGNTYRGSFDQYPKVGYSFHIFPISEAYNERGLFTSAVQEILDDNTFRTCNSIYKWEFVDAE